MVPVQYSNLYSGTVCSYSYYYDVYYIFTSKPPYTTVTSIIPKVKNILQRHNNCFVNKN